MCRLDRSEQVAQLDLATCARADWFLTLGGVELMQVGWHRAHGATSCGVEGPMHSGDNDDQAFLRSDGRDVNLCCL